MGVTGRLIIRVACNLIMNTYICIVFYYYYYLHILQTFQHFFSQNALAPQFPPGNELAQITVGYSQNHPFAIQPQSHRSPSRGFCNTATPMSPSLQNEFPSGNVSLLSAFPLFDDCPLLIPIILEASKGPEPCRGPSLAL